MKSRDHKITDQGGIYFAGFTVVEGVDAFTRKEYRDIIVECLKHFQEKKGLLIYSWCIMSNQIRLIISSAQNNPRGIVRDFKKLTGKKIIDLMFTSPDERRKKWMIKFFKKAATLKGNSEYEFWQEDNELEQIVTPQVAAQKLESIHNAPVEEGIVEKPEEYIYSSARAYYFDTQCGLISVEFLL